MQELWRQPLRSKEDLGAGRAEISLSDCSLSDLAGSDIEAHEGDYAKAIRKVRNWVTTLGVRQQIGASKLVGEYEDFRGWHFKKLQGTGFSAEDIADYPTEELINAMTEWVSIGCPRT